MSLRHLFEESDLPKEEAVPDVEAEEEFRSASEARKWLRGKRNVRLYYYEDGIGPVLAVVGEDS